MAIQNDFLNVNRVDYNIVNEYIDNPKKRKSIEKQYPEETKIARQMLENISIEKKDKQLQEKLKKEAVKNKKIQYREEIENLKKSNDPDKRIEGIIKEQQLKTQNTKQEKGGKFLSPAIHAWWKRVTGKFEDFFGKIFGILKRIFGKKEDYVVFDPDEIDETNTSHAPDNSKNNTKKDENDISLENKQAKDAILNKEAQQNNSAIPINDKQTDFINMIDEYANLSDVNEQYIEDYLKSIDYEHSTPQEIFANASEFAKKGNRLSFENIATLLTCSTGLPFIPQTTKNSFSVELMVGEKQGEIIIHSDGSIEIPLNTIDSNGMLLPNPVTRDFFEKEIFKNKDYDNLFSVSAFLKNNPKLLSFLVHSDNVVSNGLNSVKMFVESTNVLNEDIIKKINSMENKYRNTDVIKAINSAFSKYQFVGVPESQILQVGFVDVADKVVRLNNPNDYNKISTKTATYFNKTLNIDDAVKLSDLYLSEKTNHESLIDEKHFALVENHIETLLRHEVPANEISKIVNSYKEIDNLAVVKFMQTHIDSQLESGKSFAKIEYPEVESLKDLAVLIEKEIETKSKKEIDTDINEKNSSIINSAIYSLTSDEINRLSSRMSAYGDDFKNMFDNAQKTDFNINAVFNNNEPSFNNAIEDTNKDKTAIENDELTF